MVATRVGSEKHAEEPRRLPGTAFESREYFRPRCSRLAPPLRTPELYRRRNLAQQRFDCSAERLGHFLGVDLEFLSEQDFGEFYEKFFRGKRLQISGEGQSEDQRRRAFGRQMRGDHDVRVQ